MTEKEIQEQVTKFQDQSTWLSLGEGLLKIIAIIVIANILIRLGKVAIHNMFKIRNISPLSTSVRRGETLSKLLDNIISYVVYFIAFMMILSVLGIDVKALIAGAGVVGLAVGFGAQSLVKDVISGFFIIFEDQFSVGDQIRVGLLEGTVETIGLRTTKIKSGTGEVHILPNGSITQVTNFSLNNTVATIDIAISYGEDIDKAENVIGEALQNMTLKYEELTKTPELLGIQTIDPAEIVFRIVVETLPMKQSGVTRGIRKDIKLLLDENGIKAPDPRLYMYKSGS
ncbi:mechanosensitive ion channel family protein [Neobacillus vireti LMG 21834]|uniref:Mechanosensitive ion channel family protein n=2 Tax=Neobacillus TaxID=2675232 RepID=A0AB94IGH1_9BACI|nr:mechanosensitive ion channel family protein [Neobacillus vireti]ETI66209.1 mechanosensitive ion channel family protein [Neobacillus vireti LMG 21834]KLT16776.1 mechanosensitive ion channel protein MscS [Neobacillus vireti]